MNIEQFKTLHARYIIEKPKLFALAEPDRLATVQDIAKVEGEIGISLPISYREFLLNFGGGAIGFLIIFSADSGSENFLVKKRLESLRLLPPGLLVFSDDFAGGYYAFKISGGSEENSVFYWNTDGGLQTTSFNDLFEFVARYAYEPA